MKNTKYIFYPFKVRIFKNLWIFPLAVQITLDDPRYYMDRTFEITVSFLCFHAIWGFRKCS